MTSGPILTRGCGSIKFGTAGLVDPPIGVSYDWAAIMECSDGIVSEAVTIVKAIIVALVL